MSEEASIDAKNLRKEVEDFLNGYQPSEEDRATMNGCCWLSRNMTRECFNGLSPNMCSQAAANCGCRAEYVPNCVCP